MSNDEIRKLCEESDERVGAFFRAESEKEKLRNYITRGPKAATAPSAPAAEPFHTGPVTAPYFTEPRPASPEPSVTPKQLADALWQAYYHNDLDDLASDIHFHTIDGNDSPIFHETARAIIRRLVAHET